MRATQLMQKARLAGLKVVTTDQKTTISNRSVAIVIYPDNSCLRADVRADLARPMTVEAAATLLGFK